MNTDMIIYLVGTVSSVLLSANLTKYRIEQLEKKVEKHNQVVERTAILERDLKSCWRNIDEIKEDIVRIEEKETMK